MHSSNTIHINPNFVNECNGERQHIHVNPSFVLGLKSKPSFHHLRESIADLKNVASLDKYEISQNRPNLMPQDLNSERSNFTNCSLPSNLIVEPSITTFTVKSSTFVSQEKSSTISAYNKSSSYANSLKKSGITSKLHKVEAHSSCLPASQMYCSSSKYKLNRIKTSKYNLNNNANRHMEPETISNLICNKTLNIDSKTSFVRKDVRCNFQSYCSNKFQPEKEKCLFDHQQIQNNTRPIIMNKYVINRVANNTDNFSKNVKVSEFTKFKINSERIPVVPQNCRLASEMLKLPVTNLFTKHEKDSELKTPQISHVPTFKLNNSKEIVDNSNSKIQLPTHQNSYRPIFSCDNGAFVTHDKQNNKNTSNSRYKLILNSDSKNGITNKFAQPTNADALSLTSKSKLPSTSSSFALKSNTKLIPERSASRIYYQNLNKNTNLSNSWHPYHRDNKTCIVNSLSSAGKHIPKSIKNGVLIKAYQNMVLKKCRKINSRHIYCFNANKYKISNKHSMDIVKKYCIKRKSINIENVNNAIVSVKIIQSSSGTQNKAKGDLISKYKIMRCNQNNKKNQQCIHKDLVSRYKINRKEYLASKKLQGYYRSKSSLYSVMRRRSLHKSEKFVNIGGAMYKSTRTSLKKQGAIKSKIESGNLLRFSKANPGLHGMNSSARIKMNKSHSLVKSLCISKPGMLTEIVRLQKLGLFKKRNEFCMFYTRFGKCKRKEDGICPFVHDPDKIAICTRYLRGTCKVAECPFSHKLDKSKMPVCSHFLNGTCHKEDCLYRHVNVNPKAPVCSNFLKGHCPHGEECKKKHILICEDFQATGKCCLGAQCPLSHRMKKNHAKSVSQLNLRRKQNSFGNTTSGNVKSKRRVSGKVGVLGMLKLKQVDVLKKKSKSSSKRYFEPKNLQYINDVNHEDLPVENNVPLHQVSELKTSNDIFELRRKRLLKKVEKMKSLYSVGQENNVNGIIARCDNSDSQCNSKVEKIDHAQLDETTDFSLWRIPLPEVLPSYIPLVMPKFDGNS